MGDPKDIASTSDYVTMGEIVGHFGVKGWVKVKSYTRPVEEILQYANWQIVTRSADGNTQRGEQKRLLRPVQGQIRGKNLVVKLDQVQSREEAESLLGGQISVYRSDLPKLEDGQFYWDQLIGLRVSTIDGISIGLITEILETGANDVLVVRSDVNEGDESETLVPWTENVIRQVDLAAGTLLVDWALDY